MKQISDLDEFTRPKKLSIELVERFAELSRGQQLDVLTTLRARGIEDHLELALFGLVLPIIISVSIGLSPLKPLGATDWVTGIAFALTALLVALPIVLIVGGPSLVRELRRKDAVACLAAYEDELTRRREMRGKQGRRWRRSH